VIPAHGLVEHVILVLLWLRPRASITAPSSGMTLFSGFRIKFKTAQMVGLLVLANTLASMKAGDGVHFDDPLMVITKDEADTESLERPELVQLPDGGWRLYLSCATTGTKHWRVEVVDAAHPAGLIAGGAHPSPVGIADVVTLTTHKTLRGPRGGAILCGEELAKKIDSAVFPGLQGGPLEHVIAAKAVAFRIAASELFAERQRRTVDGAKALAEELLGAGHGVNVLTGGTDVHLILVDLRESEPALSGRQAEDRLAEIDITVNRNAVPFDPRPPMEASGLRIGTPALATRGLQHDDFTEVGRILASALTPEYESRAAELRERVGVIVERYPLYETLAAGTPVRV